MITDQQRAELKAKIDQLAFKHAAWSSALALHMTTPGEAVRDGQAATKLARECDDLRADIKSWIDKEL